MFIPFSAMRELMQQVDSRAFQQHTGLAFKKKTWLLAALVHPSFRNECRLHLELPSFERLEFFGDALLNVVISKALYLRFPAAEEDTLSQLRSVVVSKRILALVAQGMHLQRFIIVGKGERVNPRREYTKIVADTLEAVIAATYFDRGLPSTERFILRHFGPLLTKERLRRLGFHAKGLLQELSQRHLRTLPSYATTHRGRLFVAEVTLKPIGRALAKGRTKQAAEDHAARALIKQLKAQLASSSA